MNIAILTLDAFNELDAFISAGILNRMRPKGWKAYITSPTPTVVSMNGVTVHAERDLAFASEADAVLIGSGSRTRELVKDAALLGKADHVQRALANVERYITERDKRVLTPAVSTVR